MLSKDTLDKNYPDIISIVSDVFQLAAKNQTHPGDLLLCVVGAKNHKELSKVELGPFGEERAFGEVCMFYNHYLQNNIDSRPAIDSSIIIQNEMLLYLKIWDSSYFQRLLYNICKKLILKSGYDAYKNIERANGKEIYEDSIIKSLADIVPFWPTLFQKMYNRQIRNAIAHSQFYFLNNGIILTNKSSGYDTPLGAITVEQWNSMFQLAVVFFKAVNDAITHYQRLYIGDSNRYGFVEIRITDKDGSSFYDKVKWLEQGNGWIGCSAAKEAIKAD